MTQGQVKAIRRRFKTGDFAKRYKPKDAEVYARRQEAVINKMRAMAGRKGK